MTPRAWTRASCLLLGCLLGAGYVAAGRVPATAGVLPARVGISWARAGDFIVSPERHRLAGGELLAGPRGGRAHAGVVLLNPTSVALETRPRAIGRPEEIDDLVLVRLEAGGRRLFAGSLRALRRGGAGPFRIRARSLGTLHISARLSPGAPPARYSGRAARVRLELPTRPASRRGA